LYTAETHTHSLGDLDACLYGNSQTGFNLMGQAQPPMLAGPPCLVQNAAAPHSPAMHSRGGSRNVEGGVLIVHVQGRRKQLVVALAVHRGA